MTGWSRWAGWVVMGGLGIVVGCKGEAPDEAVRAAADAGAPPAPTPVVDAVPDGGAPAAAADAGAAVAHALIPTTVLAAGPAATIQIAGDGRGVVGITSSNGLWALGAGETTPRALVPDGAAPSPHAYLYGQLILAGDDVYWVDRIVGALHHVRRDGGGDDVLKSNLIRPGTLATDDERVYWSECTYVGEGGGVIRALARGAAPGTAPTTLVSLDPLDAVESLAVSGGVVYWVQFISVDATIYISGLFTAPTATLLAGGAGTPNAHGGDTFGLTATVAAVGDTLRVSGRGRRAGPRRRGARDRRGRRPAGATFVDGGGNLVAVAPADLKAAALNQAP
jgi:hypothetical protein